MNNKESYLKQVPHDHFSTPTSMRHIINRRPVMIPILLSLRHIHGVNIAPQFLHQKPHQHHLLIRSCRCRRRQVQRSSSQLGAMSEEEFENGEILCGGGSGDVIEQRGLLLDVRICNLGTVVETPADKSFGGADMVDGVVGVAGVGTV